MRYIISTLLNENHKIELMLLEDTKILSDDVEKWLTPENLRQNVRRKDKTD